MAPERYLVRLPETVSGVVAIVRQNVEALDGVVVRVRGARAVARVVKLEICFAFARKLSGNRAGKQRRDWTRSRLILGETTEVAVAGGHSAKFRIRGGNT